MLFCTRSTTLLSLAAVLLLPAGLSAQVSGRISGSVLDPSGNVIVGAKVMAENERTREVQTAQTSETGAFVFPGMQPSSYTIRVQADGFSVYEKKNIILNANQILTVGNIALAIGSTTETVTVMAQGAMVQAETSGNTALITDKQLGGLMSRGRDIVSLMTILPGVSQTISSDSLGGNWGTETPNMQGARSHWNTFSLDGQPGNDIDVLNFFTISVSMDAIEEVSVKSMSYLAEDGRLPGASVNIVSKSGTREFHGSAYWFKRHEQFNANDFFNNRLGIPRPLTRYNTLGVTFGGPVYIPGKFNSNREKLFFFVSRENWGIKLPTPRYEATVPTALERAGNFSQSFDQNGVLIPVFDPNTQTPFPNNVVPASRINPLGQAMLNIFPAPNQTNLSLTGGAFNYQFQEIRRQPKHQTQLKVDYLISSKDRVTFRPRFWSSDLQGQFQGVALSSNVFMQPHHYLYPNRQYSASYTRTISPNIVNEFDFGFGTTEELGTLTDEFDLRNARRENVGLAGLRQLHPEANPLNLIPRMTFGGLPNAVNVGFDLRTPIAARDERYYFTNNLSWIKGAHTMKFGVFYERNHASEGPRSSGGGHMGSFDFSRDRNNPLDSNHPFANAVLGNFRSYAEANAMINGQAKATTVEWFAQDSWKVNRRLNIDYGMRFHWFTPWRLRNNLGAALALSRLDPARMPTYFYPGIGPDGRRAAINPLNGQAFPQPYIGAYVPNHGDRLNGMLVGVDPSYADGWRNVPPIQLAPRFGFAYDVAGDNKTVVRGGIAVTKQTISSSGASTGTPMTSVPLIETPTIFYSDMNSYLSSSGVLFPPVNVQAFELDFKPATVYRWSLGIQRDIGFGSVLDVSYVGNTGRHLYQRRNLNGLAPGVRFLPSSQDRTTNRPLPDNFLRPIFGYQNVNYLENSGYSNYHALQVGLNRRYARGLQYGLAYTWSKAMGISDQDGAFLPQYRDYRSYLYGKLSFDQTHMFIFNYLWSVPNVGAFGKNAVTKGIFHNWELAGITTFSSGQPTGINFSRTDNLDRQGGGDAPRVWMLQNPLIPRNERNFDRWFNTNAFAPPELNEFGNAPRDVFRRPGIHNWDLTVMKNFPVREKVRIQLRGEFYNVFNHTQYAGVDNAARFDAQGRQVSARFGQVTGTRLPRNLQLALRLEF